MSLLWHTTEKCVYNKRYHYGKLLAFYRTNIFILRIRERVQKRYARKEDMVGAPGIFFLL